MDNKLKAVSLKYPENADAPFITASGKALIAEKMMEIAKEKGIPVVQDSNLTNLLSLQKSGDFIPVETFEAVAKIFAFIARLEQEENLND